MWFLLFPPVTQFDLFDGESPGGSLMNRLLNDRLVVRKLQGIRP